MKIQRILFALVLLAAYPAIADMAAHAETLPGATNESLQQQRDRMAIEANDPNLFGFHETSFATVRLWRERQAENVDDD